MHNEIARSLSHTATIVGFIVASGAFVLFGRKAAGHDRRGKGGTPPSSATIDEQQKWIGDALGERAGSLNRGELRWLRSHRDLVLATLSVQARRREAGAAEAAPLVGAAPSTVGDRIYWRGYGNGVKDFRV